MLILGHRGDSAHAPENTLAAIKLAFEKNCDGIEIDVQLTKDKELVVFHDWDVERTTNGTGFVSNFNLSKLKTLDTGSWFSKKYKNEKIATLKEILEVVPNNKLVNIELKVRHGKKTDIEIRVLKLLEKMNMSSNTILSSFNHRVIKNINGIDSKIKTGLLITSSLLNIKEYIKSNNLNLYSLHLSGEFLDKSTVDEMKKENVKIYAWTINTKEEAEKMKNFGVDGIITNYPEILD